MLEQRLGGGKTRQFVETVLLGNLKQLPALMEVPVQIIDDFGETYFFVGIVMLLVFHFIIIFPWISSL